LTLSKAVEFGRAPVEVDPTRMCALLVGLSAVTVLGVDDVAGGGSRPAERAPTGVSAGDGEG